MTRAGGEPEREQAGALPAALADPRPVVAAGTLAWFAAAAVLAVAGIDGTWLWACLTGGVLGVASFPLMHVQRRHRDG